jgi:hypothetical protein
MPTRRRSRPHLAARRHDNRDGARVRDDPTAAFPAGCWMSSGEGMGATFQVRYHNTSMTPPANPEQFYRFPRF